MKIWKYYIQAMGGPSLFVLLFSLLYGLLISSSGSESADITLVPAVIIPAALFALLMSVISLPIFLNKINRFSTSLLFNLLTWFLLPGIYIALVLLHEIGIRTKFSFGYGDDFIYLLFMILPFLLGLTLTFYQYRKNLLKYDSTPNKSGITDSDEKSEGSAMSRRRFVALSLAGAATAGAGAFLVHSFSILESKVLLEKLQPQMPFDTKKTFHRCGACSNMLFTVLNRAYGRPNPLFEIATDPLAGGLYNSQNQCGMLWGATMALGAESWRTCSEQKLAISMAMEGARDIVKSFKNRTSSANCRDIMDFNWVKPTEFLGFLLPSLPGGYLNMKCMNLAEKWVPEAYLAIRESKKRSVQTLHLEPKSCASEVVHRLGGNEEQAAMVAGMAGGIGFSGNACGALGAAIWMNTVNWCRENPEQSGYLNPKTKEIMQAFLDATDSEITCSGLSRHHFASVKDHTEFINDGGCSELINLLVEVAV